MLFNFFYKFDINLKKIRVLGFYGYIYDLSKNYTPFKILIISPLVRNYPIRATPVIKCGKWDNILELTPMSRKSKPKVLTSWIFGLNFFQRGFYHWDPIFVPQLCLSQPPMIIHRPCSSHLCNSSFTPSQPPLKVQCIENQTYPIFLW